MSAIVAGLVVLAAGTYALKVAGPMLAAGRTLPPWARRLAELMTAALLAALVATQTLASGTTLIVDARLVGVAAAGLAVWRRAPFIVVVVIGAATTGVLRAAGWN